MGGSDVADGVLLFPLSAILSIPVQVAPAHRVTTSTAHTSRANDFSRADVEFVTIVFYSSFLSNVCVIEKHTYCKHFRMDQNFPVMKQSARGWCVPKAHLSTRKIRALYDGGFCQVVRDRIGFRKIRFLRL
jgi:hypothetical protein